MFWYRSWSLLMVWLVYKVDFRPHSDTVGRPFSLWKAL
ncbi:hypothetical protein M758_4G073300 [Ceratodon purpureus]|nr:hypothetical protein M758_4G073300 [Ceratodon purpureus]